MSNQNYENGEPVYTDKKAEKDNPYYCKMTGLFAVYRDAKMTQGTSRNNEDYAITTFTATVGARYKEADNGTFFNFVCKNRGKAKYLSCLVKSDKVVITAHPETYTGSDGNKYTQWVVEEATIVAAKKYSQQNNGQPAGGQPNNAQQNAGQQASGGYQQNNQQGRAPQGQPYGGGQYGSYTPPTGGGYPQNTSAPSGQQNTNQQPSGQYGNYGNTAGQQPGGQAYPQGGGQPANYGNGQPNTTQGSGQPSSYPDGFGMGADDDPFGFNSGAPDNY